MTQRFLGVGDCLATMPQSDMCRPSPAVGIGARGIKANGFLEIAQRELGAPDTR